MPDALVTVIEAHFHALVDGHPDRHVDSPGIDQAAAHVRPERRRQGREVSEAPCNAVAAGRACPVDRRAPGCRPARQSVHAARRCPVAAGPVPLVVADALAVLEAADVAAEVLSAGDAGPWH